jgi:beta-hydroxylase
MQKKMLFILILFYIFYIFYTNIFYKLNKSFYTVNETYPFLNSINDIKTIQQEVIDILDKSVWNNWPEYNLWNSKKSNKWTVYPLMAFGKWSENNIKKCSKTYEMLKDIPGLVNVLFSRFSPGTVLEPHQGWANLSNYILRCHLGIIVPGISYVYCNNEKEKHEEGKWIIFDDSKEHYANNLGTSDRIILILDIKRPSNVQLGKSTVEDSDELKSFITAFNEK